MSDNRLNEFVFSFIKLTNLVANYDYITIIDKRVNDTIILIDKMMIVEFIKTHQTIIDIISDMFVIGATGDGNTIIITITDDTQKTKLDHYGNGLLWHHIDYNYILNYYKGLSIFVDGEEKRCGDSVLGVVAEAILPYADQYEYLSFAVTTTRAYYDLYVIDISTEVGGNYE